MKLTTTSERQRRRCGKWGRFFYERNLANIVSAAPHTDDGWDGRPGRSQARAINGTKENENKIVVRAQKRIQNQSTTPLPSPERKGPSTSAEEQQRDDRIHLKGAIGLVFFVKL